MSGEDASSDAAPIQLAGYFLEWDLIEAEKDELSERSKALFKAMKDGGYDTKAARAIFREKRIEQNSTADDRAKADEAEQINDSYRAALDRGLAARARPAHTHEKTLNNSAPSELTQTQEQPGSEPANHSAGVQYCAVRDAPLESASDEISSVISPSPETPQAIADEEAAPPAKSSAPFAPDPHSSEVDDGQPQPSANVPPAQKDIGLPDVGQDGTVPTHSSGEFAQQSASAVQARNEPGSASGASVTLPQSEIPAFLRKSAADLRKSAADFRPHCQHPEACGSSNPTGHCDTCKRAMEAAESEVAA